MLGLQAQATIRHFLWICWPSAFLPSELYAQIIFFLLSRQYKLPPQTDSFLGVLITLVKKKKSTLCPFYFMGLGLWSSRLGSSYLSLSRAGTESLSHHSQLLCTCLFTYLFSKGNRLGTQLKTGSALPGMYGVLGSITRAAEKEGGV